MILFGRIIGIIRLGSFLLLLNVIKKCILTWICGMRHKALKIV